MKPTRQWIDLFGLWVSPKKPECQSCSSFIFCAMNQVERCPKLKRSWPDRLWRWLRGLLNEP